MERFVPFQIEKTDTPRLKLQKMRVNGLGSLFYFIKVPLRRKRLTDFLHRSWCASLEREHIKDLYEFPRDHFKSTICSEGFPIWRSLPFSKQDEDFLLANGYTSEFVRFMRRVHNQDLRNLLVCENVTNAAKLGKRISGHYESNAIFRVLYPEIIPDSSCTWSSYSLHHRRSKGNDPHGEGTFDFLGVGGALQSRHYNGLLIQDDLIGRKAIESVSIMEKAIDYHQLAVGAFENPESATHENDEFIVGNRWSYNDLNSYLREKEPWFRVVSHSALGGCCPQHPADTPIFPEEFSFDKLMKLKQRLGNYHFSCQYLNNPAAPENADFRPEYLNYFTLEGPGENNNFQQMIRFEVKDGQVHKDIPLRHLRIAMTVDPNHSGNAGLGRCRHSIQVLGLTSDDNYIHLDSWAKASSYDELYGKIFELADKWGLRKVGVESVAAQKYIGHHIQHMAFLKSRPLGIIELKGEVEGPDGELTRKKEWRIRNVLAPIFEGGRFFTQRKFQDFFGEYSTFPKGKYVDSLDALAYLPGMLKRPLSYERGIKMRMENQRGAMKVRPPYSAGVGSSF